MLCVISLIVGISLVSYWDSGRFDEFVDRRLTLSAPERVDDWTHNPASVLVKFYFYEVINLSAMENKGFNNVKPLLREKGPFVYEERQEKTRVIWNENGTVSFIPKTTYQFRRDLSVAGDSEPIPVLDAQIVAVENSYNKTWHLQSGMDKYFGKEGLFWKTWTIPKKIVTTVSVRDHIWGSYHNKLLTFLKDIVAVPDSQYSKMGGLIGFSGKNYHNEGEEYTMFTGAENIDNLGIITHYKGSRKLNVWVSDVCDTVSGCDGFTFPGNLKPDVKLSVFQPDLCRPLILDFEEERTYGSLPVYRYGISKSYLDPYALENQCYCNQVPSHVSCGANGTVSTVNCSNGFQDWPLVYSKPHFLHADPQLRAPFKHMNPDESLHDSYFDIVPKMGIPVASKLRLQINIEIKESFNTFFRERRPQFTTIAEGIYPICWFERGYDTLRPSQMSKLTNILHWHSNLRWGVGGAMLTLSFVFFFIFIFMIISPDKYFFYTKEPQRIEVRYLDVKKLLEESMYGIDT